MISAVSEVSTEDLLVPEISADDANSRDRTRRLRCAADPATPVPMLLELAMEFPEVVAANPSIRVGLAADPRPFASAGAVAIACLLTSPAIERGFADALEAVVMREGLHESVDHLRAYLAEWRRLGARRLAIDLSQPRPATEGLEPSVERKTRGLALLARRLGWCGASGWNDRRYLSDAGVTCTPAGQLEEGGSNLDIFIPDQLKSPNEFSTPTTWRLRCKEPSKATIEVEVCPSCAVGQFTINEEDEFDGEIFSFNFQVTDSFDLDPTQDAVRTVKRVLAPLCEAAKGLAPGQAVLIVDCGDVHTLTVGVAAVYEALADWSESLSEAIEEGDDEPAAPPETKASFPVTPIVSTSPVAALIDSASMLPLDWYRTTPLSPKV